MKPKIIIPILVLAIAATAVGYVLGAGKQSAVNSQSRQANSAAPAASEEEVGVAKIPGAEHIHAIAYDSDGNLLLGTHGGLFKSTDGGKTWNKIQTKGSVNVDDWMSLVSDPRNRKVMYAGGHDLGVIKSEDSGTTWARADTGIQGTDIHGLTINQRNPNHLFAYSVNNGMFRSTDGGASWIRLDDGPDNPSVQSLSYLAVQTSMDKRMGWDNWGLLMSGTADGIYQSFSCFCGWSKTAEVFSNATVYVLTTLHKDLRTIYAGTKDGAWKSTDEGQTWTQLSDLRGVKITAMTINPDNAEELFASAVAGTIYHSTDAGSSWQEVK